MLEDEHDELVKLVLIFLTLNNGFLFGSKLFGQRDHKNEWNFSLAGFRANLNLKIVQLSLKEVD